MNKQLSGLNFREQMTVAQPDDVSRLSQARHALTALSKPVGGDGFLRTVEAIALPCLVTDKSRGPDAPIVLAINDAFEDLCGYAPSEICGLSPKLLHGPDTDVLAAHKFHDDLERNGRALTDLVNYHKDGSAYEVMLIGARVRAPDQVKFRSDDFFISFAFRLGDAPFCLARTDHETYN